MSRHKSTPTLDRFRMAVTTHLEGVDAGERVQLHTLMADPNIKLLKLSRVQASNTMGRMVRSGLIDYHKTSPRGYALTPAARPENATRIEPVTQLRADKQRMFKIDVVKATGKVRLSIDNLMIEIGVV